MRALLLHDTGSDAEAVAALEAAGYDVVRCAEPGHTGFPCAAAAGACPLDATVDVAVAVHDRDTADLAPGEVGVVCALRDGVPLVAAGTYASLAAGGLADALATSVDGLADACERARAASAARAAAAIDAVAGTAAGTTVERHGDVVEVTLGAGATERTGVLAHQVARRRYPAVRTITVRHR